ncbi:MAG: C39 family peptidase [Candidatus Margulisbacteria bacterium]|nr:C39 family peptidase [Candidatus Margulisiibacteriota bacterium]
MAPITPPPSAAQTPPPAWGLKPQTPEAAGGKKETKPDKPGAASPIPQWNIKPSPAIDTLNYLQNKDKGFQIEACRELGINFSELKDMKYSDLEIKIKAFQEKYGFEKTGLFDNKTKTLLESLVNNTDILNDRYAILGVDLGVLREGSLKKGELQEKIKYFQEKHGLEKTGYINDFTFSASEPYDKYVEELLAHDDIGSLRDICEKLGINFDDLTQRKLTPGKLSEKIKYFQEKHGLEKTGKFEGATQFLLESNDEEKIKYFALLGITYDPKNPDSPVKPDELQKIKTFQEIVFDKGKPSSGVIDRKTQLLITQLLEQSTILESLSEEEKKALCALLGISGEKLLSDHPLEIYKLIKGLQEHIGLDKSGILDSRTKRLLSNINKLNADGIINKDNIKQKIADFQQKHNLPQKTGILDRWTLEKLESVEEPGTTGKPKEKEGVFSSKPEAYVRDNVQTECGLTDESDYLTLEGLRRLSNQELRKKIQDALGINDLSSCSAEEFDEKVFIYQLNRSAMGLGGGVGNLRTSMADGRLNLRTIRAIDQGAVTNKHEKLDPSQKKEIDDLRNNYLVKINDNYDEQQKLKDSYIGELAKKLVSSKKFEEKMEESLKKYFAWISSFYLQKDIRLYTASELEQLLPSKEILGKIGSDNFEKLSPAQNYSEDIRKLYEFANDDEYKQYAKSLEQIFVKGSYGLNISNLLACMMKKESGGNNRALSPKGAMGAMQFMRGTAISMAKLALSRGIIPQELQGKFTEIANGVKVQENLADKKLSLILASVYINNIIEQLITKFPELKNDPQRLLTLVLASYNAGENRVLKNGGHVPDIHETKDYVAKITDWYYKLQNNGIDKNYLEVNKNIRIEEIKYKNNKFVYYNQGDPNWGGISYSRNGSRDQNIASSGCGPTSMAMVASTITGKNYTPDKLAAFSLAKGYRTSSEGTGHGFFPAAAKAYGLDYQSEGVNSIDSALDQGRMVIVSMKPGSFTTGGHFIVIIGRDKETGKYLVMDPNRGNRSYFNGGVKLTGTAGLVLADNNIIKTQGKAAWSFSAKSSSFAS